MGGRRLTVKNVQICGMQAQVTRKPIRNMYLRIRPDDGTLLISAPMQLPDSEIRRFVESRMEAPRTDAESPGDGRQRNRLALGKGVSHPVSGARMRGKGAD